MGAGPLIASRVGGFLAAVTIYVVLIAGLVLAPFIVVGGGRAAVRWTSARSSPTPPCCSGSRRSCPPSTFRAARSSTRPWRWRRTATCSRSEAWRSSSPGSAGVGPPGIPVPRRGWQRWCRGRRRARRADVGRRRPRAGRPGVTALAVRDALDEPVPPRPGHVDRRGGDPLLDRRGGVVLVNDPVATIGEVADAYDIDWLVLDRGAVDTTTRSSTATGRRGSARRSSRTATRPSWGSTRSIGGRPNEPPRSDPVALDLRRRARRARVLRRADRVPEARGHGVLRRRRAEPAQRPRARVRRPVELRHAAARGPPRRVRGVAAAADVLAAIPMAIAGQTFVAAQVSSILSGRSSRCSWRLAADVAQELELPVGRARTWRWAPA